MSAIKTTTNKFAPLQVDEEGTSDEGSKTNWVRRIDKFVATRQDPPLSETGKWNEEMIQYYKDQRKRAWESNKRDVVFEEEIELDEYDVFVDKSANAKFMSENKVRARRSGMRNCVCDRIVKVCDKIFGNWNWQHNLDMSKQGCKIIVGWNQDSVQCHLIQSTRQTMCYMVEVLKSNIKFFTFIYAANHGRDRKELWQDLCIYKRLIGDVEWVIMGDMNVTLNTNERSEGMSHFTHDMKDFQDCINEIKMADLCSSGFQYTWTKSLKNPNATILKKLDRIIVLLSSTVLANWEKNFNGHAMYQLVYKLKGLKPLLNKLNWKNGNLFTRVENLKIKLFNTQAKIDKDPCNKKFREDEVKVLAEYLEATQDEEKIMGADGSVFEKDQVGTQFAKHFETFLGTTSDAVAMTDDDTCLFNKIDSQDAENMCSEVTTRPLPEFLGKDTNNFGFPSSMIQWIMVCISTPKFIICVNGERFGYFRGGRGLRQGDPISPYLFTLVIEVLNLFLKDEIAKERNFKYHLGCKKLKITHLCLADDLLVLSHGDTTSISTIKRALEKFSKIGKLPVKYLGVPLMDKKIGVKDCKSLVDKVRQKLGDWKNKSLSYAGRGQLIASILSSMQVYWGGKAKVAWKDVCMPKEQGRFKVGNGRSISAWYDRWDENQALAKNISKREIHLAGFDDLNKLYDVIDDNKWKWPAKWFGKYNFLHNYHVPTLAAEPDTLMWVTMQGKLVKFSTNQVWVDVRSIGNKVHWDKLVCDATMYADVSSEAPNIIGLTINVVPSSYANKLSPKSLTKANLRKLEANVPNVKQSRE
ncbi:RNA-directed DNA polymerase, eukaryota, reverse transcriptase zinc-binding domain protein [Tanacetum coccineum]